MTRLFLALLLVSAALVPANAQSLDQMAGQMVIVGFNGDDAGDASVKAIAGEIGDGTLGGVMFLKTNVKTLKSVAAMNTAFRAAAKAGGLPPPFITLDQEGGAVERLTKDVGFPEVASAATIAAQQTPKEAEATYESMARGIAKLGFSVNFGPVADLAVNPKNQVIAKFGRAFGKTGDTVTAYDEAFIAAHHAAGLITSLKHFPGHGSSTADSHEGFVDITRTWSRAELAPYQALFAKGYADFVMVGHLYHEDYSGGGDRLPASLSPDWITGVLRTELGFTGVVISDDLEMGAIRKRFDLHDTVVRAVRAGVDVLLFSNTAKYDPKLSDRVRGILVAEAQSDPAFRTLVEASYARIIALKARIGG